MQRFTEIRKSIIIKLWVVYLKIYHKFENLHQILVVWNLLDKTSIVVGIKHLNGD